GLAICASVAAVLLLAAGLAIWVCASEGGLRFVSARVAARLPPGVSIDTIGGRLLGPLTLGGIAVRTDRLEVRIASAELRWNPRALLARTLDVERLDLRGVDVVTIPGTAPREPAAPLRLPESVELPIRVRVGAVSLETIRYR